MRDRIQLMTNMVVTSQMSDPAAARGQAMVMLGQSIEKQAFTIGYGEAFAAVAAILLLAAFLVLISNARKLRGVRAAWRTQPKNPFSELRTRSLLS